MSGHPLYTPETGAWSLFQEPWWLDAVAPGAWREVRVEQGGNLMGRWPFVVKERLGATLLADPLLTQYVGPWFRPNSGKASTQFSERRELWGELLAQLPTHDFLSIQCHPELDDWLPARWKGFEQTTYYTLKVPPQPEEQAWQALDANIRNGVRKAQKSLKVVREMDLERMLDILDLTYRRQGLETPHDRDLYRRVAAASRAMGRELSFSAVDEEGRIHAVLFAVEGPTEVHGIWSAGDPELRKHSGPSLLYWEAIREAHARGKTYNFGGSIIEPIHQYMRQFGTELVPFSHLQRSASRRMDLMLGLRALGKAFAWRRG